MTVTSLANTTVKLLASLRHDKYRQEHGLFLAEGVRMVREGIEAGHTPKFLAVLADEASQDVAHLKKNCAAQGGAVIEVTNEVLAKIAHKDNPQSVVAAFPVPRRNLDALDPKAGDLFVALDRIRDPGNLGTVIRTAHAVNAAGVVLVGACCDPFAPESVRASTGSIFRVPVYEGDEKAFVALAKTWPGTVAGTAAMGRDHYRTAAYAPPVLAVLGTEQSGMSEAVAGACHPVVRIPMFGGAESLNLAVAAGVLLYGIRERFADEA